MLNRFVKLNAQNFQNKNKFDDNDYTISELTENRCIDYTVNEFKIEYAKGFIERRKIL